MLPSLRITSFLFACRIISISLFLVCSFLLFLVKFTVTVKSHKINPFPTKQSPAFKAADAVPAEAADHTAAWSERSAGSRHGWKHDIVRYMVLGGGLVKLSFSLMHPLSTVIPLGSGTTRVWVETREAASTLSCPSIKPFDDFYSL